MSGGLLSGQDGHTSVLFVLFVMLDACRVKLVVA
jgi:hypothetical protein